MKNINLEHRLWLCYNDVTGHNNVKYVSNDLENVYIIPINLRMYKSSDRATTLGLILGSKAMSV